MPEKNKLGIGLIGCGRISDLQGLGYNAHAQAEIIAVCDPDKQRAQQCAKKWQVKKIYSDLHEMLADKDIQVVDILTPHHLHVSMAIAALKAGKHVSLQKPPTLTLEELDEIIKVAQSCPGTIRVFDNFIFYPPHVKVEKLISEGAIGDPLSIRLKTAVGPDADGWLIPPKTLAWRQNLTLSGGGPLTFDHGYHCFSLARLFMPVEVSRIHAFIHWTKLGKNKWTDGPALISWKYEGPLPRYGSWEVILTSKMKVRSPYYPSDDRLEIHGSEGIIWVNKCCGNLLDEPSIILYRDGETRSFHHIPSDWSESFKQGGIDFIDCLLNKKQPAQSLLSARKTLALALAAAKSAAETKELSINEIYGS